MERIKYFIDFDDVLFDRKRFTSKLFSILKKNGFSDDEIESSYRAVYQDGYEGIAAQIDYLNEYVRSFDINSANLEAIRLLTNLKDYVYDEAKPFLQKIDRSFYFPVLITVGGVGFQRAKVQGSGIEEIFGSNNCIYTFEDKDIALLRCLPETEKFVFLDDKIRTLEKVSKTFPNAIVIKTKDGDLLKYSDPLNIEYRI